MGYSPLGASVNGISGASILVWIAISSPEGFSYPGIETTSPSLQVGSLPLRYIESPYKSINYRNVMKKMYIEILEHLRNFLLKFGFLVFSLVFQF